MSVMGYGYTCEGPNSFRIGLLPVSIQFGKVLVYRKQTGTHKSCFSLKKKWQKIYKVYPFALKEIISKLCSLLIYIYIYIHSIYQAADLYIPSKIGCVNFFFPNFIFYYAFCPTKKTCLLFCDSIIFIQSIYHFHNLLFGLPNP